MDNHKFTPLLGPTSTICKICYRPKLDEYHIAFFDATEISHVKPPKNHSGTVEIFVDGETVTSAAVQKLHENLPECNGHKCIICGIRFMHTYKCWPGPNSGENGYCPVHFGQVEVEINREKNLKQIVAESENVLSGKRLAEIAINHESFVVLEFSKIEDYEQRREAIIEHINKMRGLCEQFSKQIAVTKKVLQNMDKAELDKLTPEEIADFHKRAVRQKKQSVETAIDERKKQWAAQLKELTKIIGKDAAEVQLRTIYSAQGKEIPE